MSKHMTVPIPEESFFIKADSPKELGILGIFEAISCLYVIVISIAIRMAGEGLGQERPKEILLQIILPSIKYYTILFSIVGTIPFIILRYKGVSPDNYPKSNNGGKNSILSTIGFNFIYAYNNVNTTYAIIGPIYYLHFRYNTTSPIGLLEVISGIIYTVAFILGFRFLVYFLTGSVNCFLDMVNMWKFTVFQLRRQRHINIY